MKDILINISNSIPDNYLQIFDTLAQVSAEHDARFVIIGATARDLILQYGFGISTPRITMDIDVAIYMHSWDIFDAFKNQLMATKQFRQAKEVYRLVHENGIPIDIVPFGNIEAGAHHISWPPTHEIIMSVLGFEDAYLYASSVRISNMPIIDIRVANLTSLVALKIIAWNSRYPLSQKDALDVAFISRVYLDAGNQNRFAEEHSDMLTEDFDYLHASARLLGRDMTNVLSFETKAQVIQILDQEIKEQNRYKLVEDMTQEYYREQFDVNLILLKKIQLGLND